MMNSRIFRRRPRPVPPGELLRPAGSALGYAAQEPLLREALLPLLPRLKAALIFCSVTKQTDTSQSDIDIMLIGENLLLADILMHLTPLETQLGRKISPTCYSPADFERRRTEPDSFVNRTLSQPILPLIGDVNESARAR